jgi:hypothetical protein
MQRQIRVGNGLSSYRTEVAWVTSRQHVLRFVTRIHSTGLVAGMSIIYLSSLQIEVVAGPREGSKTKRVYNL